MLPLRPRTMRAPLSTMLRSLRPVGTTLPNTLRLASTQASSSSTSTTAAAANDTTILSEEEASKKYGNHGRPMTIDRELPNPLKDRTYRRVQFVGFWVLMGVASVLMFNYEKTNSPIVTTTLHFLRRSKIVREVLGDEIDFASIYPWISGELNQVKGVVNITFDVKGSKQQGTISLKADRANRHHDFLIHEWSLTVGDTKLDLLDDDSVDFSV
ncbi:CYFA0S01e08856g1_1 [Cyberlindnera fabianii]|uniref:CYFA0S01e08856g1_1 n=1 Tax=Cyberlindnera fabianii TaxID=36022 RepID=A0A061APD7_CYBFA|nr:CYFA0S01e08856g1_1 [Cyberlindnera fabianii]